MWLIYFAERNRESQLVSLISEQGKEISSLKSLNNKFDEFQKALFGQAIDRPVHWAGFALRPLRIEFLEFKDTRFNEKTLYHL